MRPYYAFPEWYDRVGHGLPGEVEFYVDLARACRGAVLELGCGTGRITLPLAEAGCEVVAVDLSEPMLERARRKAAAAGLGGRIEWRQADMRRLTDKRRFNLVIAPYRTFLHNLTEHDQAACLASVRRLLSPEGRFAFNVFVPDTAHIARAYGEAVLENRFVDAENGHEILEWESAEWDPGLQRLYSRQIFEEVDADGRTLARQHMAVEVSYIHPREAQWMLLANGFEIEALYGDFEGAPFGPDAEELVVIARPARG